MFNSWQRKMAVTKDSWLCLAYWTVPVFMAAFGHVSGFLTSRACLDDLCENHTLTCPGSDKMVVFDILANAGSGFQTLGPHGNLYCYVNRVTSVCRQGDVICPKLPGVQTCAVCSPNNICLHTPAERAATNADLCVSTCTNLRTGSDIRYACLSDLEKDDSEKTTTAPEVYVSHSAITSATYRRGHVCGVESAGLLDFIVSLTSTSRDCDLNTTVRFANASENELPCNASVVFDLTTPFLVTMEAASDVSLPDASGYVIIELKSFLRQTMVVSCIARSNPNQGSTIPSAVTTTPTTTAEMTTTSTGLVNTTQPSTRITVMSTVAPSGLGRSGLDTMYLAVGVLGLLLCIIALVIIVFACRLRAREKQKQRTRRHFVNLDLSPIESRDPAPADGGQRYDEVEISTENHYATPELVPRSRSASDNNSGSVYFVLENPAPLSTPSSGTSRNNFTEDESPLSADVDTTQAVYAELEPEVLVGSRSPECPRRLSTFKPSPQTTRRWTQTRTSTAVPRAKSLHLAQVTQDEPYDILGRKKHAKKDRGRHVYDHLSMDADGVGGAAYHHLSFEPHRSGIIIDNPYHIASVVDGHTSTTKLPKPTLPSKTVSKDPRLEKTFRERGEEGLSGTMVGGAGGGAADAETSSLPSSDVSLCDHFEMGLLGPRPRRQSDSTVLEDSDLRRLLAGRSGRRHSEFTVRTAPPSSDLSYLDNMAVSESGFSDSGREPSLSSYCMGEAADEDANEVDIRVYIA